MIETTKTDTTRISESSVRFDLWLSGENRSARSGATFRCTSPFDGSVQGEFANGGEDDANEAINTARLAFDSGPWPCSSARTRFEVLTRFADIIQQRTEVLTDRMALESGKPINVGRAEVHSAVKTIQYYAGMSLQMEGSAINERLHDALGLILREPIGVAAFITPWNYPILNPTIKLAAALTAGCTVVAKPSHLCPGPTVLLAHFLAEAGLPDGVFNVITSDIEGGALVGQTLSKSPRVDKIAFTGSSSTGQAVMRAAASNTKSVSLELGGKSANIIFDDAPLDVAISTAVRAFCTNSGQNCAAGTRLLIQKGVYDEVLNAVVDLARREVLGEPRDETTTMGPLVNGDQFQRVMNYVAIGDTEGTMVTGGGPPTGREGSYFVEPTIFAGVSSEARIAQEETFGPLLTVIPFDTEQDAIRIANDSRYGLAGGVWSASIDKALRVVKGVRTGKMFVNCYNDSGLDNMPHGGYKESGIGREFGQFGLYEFQHVKTVQIKLQP